MVLKCGALGQTCSSSCDMRPVNLAEPPAMRAGMPCAMVPRPLVTCLWSFDGVMRAGLSPPLLWSTRTPPCCSALAMCLEQNVPCSQ